MEKDLTQLRNEVHLRLKSELVYKLSLATKGKDHADTVAKKEVYEMIKKAYDEIYPEP